MVIEIPSHECFEVQKTRRYKVFKDLEEWFIKNIGAPASKFVYLKKHIPLTITGVGFFDIHTPRSDWQEIAGKFTRYYRSNFLKQFGIEKYCNFISSSPIRFF